MAENHIEALSLLRSVMFTDGEIMYGSGHAVANTIAAAQTYALLDIADAIRESSRGTAGAVDSAESGEA